MAFCENCGKTLAEGEVCSCTVPEKKGKSGLIFMIVLALVIVVLAVVLIIALASGSDSEESDEKDEEKKIEVKSTYMDPVDELIKLVNKREADVLALKNAFIPDFAAKKYNKILNYFEESGEFQDELTWRNEDLEDTYEYIQEEFGDWTISFEESEAIKMTESDLNDYAREVEDSYDDYLEDFRDELEDMLEDDEEIEEYADIWETSEEQTKKIFEAWISYIEEYEKLKVSEGYKVSGKFILESEKGEYESGMITFVVLQVNDSWVYMGVEYCETLYFYEDTNNYFSFFFEYIRESHLFSAEWF